MKSIISALLILALVFSALALMGCNGTGDRTPGTSAPSSKPYQTTDTPDPGDTEPESVYVINTTSRKFHLPDCTYALKISESNRDTSSLPASKLIDEGYVACGHCLGDLSENETVITTAGESSQTSSDAADVPDTNTPDSTVAPQGELCVLNTGTKKIHKPDCRYANNQNREEYTGDIQALLDEGYTLCKTCHKD